MCTVNHRIGTFHDSRTESVILQAVFCWWDSSSRHELLDGFPHPHGYPPASSPGARRMNADPWSAFRLSPLREPDARTRADRFSVRATSRTCLLIHLSKIAARTVSAEWARRRSNPRLRCFKPPLYRLSYQPRMGIGHEKRPDVARDTGPFGKAPESDLCHKRKVRTGAVFAGSPAKHASTRCSEWRLDHKNIIVPIPSALRPS